MRRALLLLVLLAGCGSVTVSSELVAGDGAAGARGADAALEGAAGAAAAAGSSGAAGTSSDAGAELAQRDAGAEAAPTPAGSNLVPNGDFSTPSTAGWHVGPNSGATLAIVNGQLCMTLPASAGALATVGWPEDPTKGVPLAGGQVLRLSFKVSTSAPLSMFLLQVGHADVPYTPDFEPTVTPPAQSSPTTFSQTFVEPIAGDTSAGVAFSASSTTAGATVCFDDVYLGP